MLNLEINDTGTEFVKSSVQRYFISITFVFLFAYFTNSACLFFDYDGVNWAVLMEYVGTFSSPFSTAMVDPLQGMFDVFMQGYRGGLPPVLILQVIGDDALNKQFILLFYSLFVSFSIYHLARSIGFNRKISLFAPLMYATLTLPLFTDTGVIDSISGLNPNYVYLIGINALSISIVWRINGANIKAAILYTLFLSLLLLGAAISLVPIFSYVCLITLVFGLGSLASTSDKKDILVKLGCGLWVVLFLTASGIPTYALDLSSATPYHFFGNELFGIPVTNENFTEYPELWFESIKNNLWDTTTSRPLFIGLFCNFIIIFITRNRKIKAFSITYIVCLIVYHSAYTFVRYGYWVNLGFGEYYSGPTLYRIPSFLTPIAMISIAGLFLWALNYALTACFSIRSGFIQNESIATHGLIRRLRFILANCCRIFFRITIIKTVIIWLTQKTKRFLLVVGMNTNLTLDRFPLRRLTSRWEL